MALRYIRSATVFAVLNVASSINVTTGNSSTPSLGVPENVQHLWGQYSPWFSKDQYKAPPDGCDIVQVNLLQRHGARFPDKDVADAIQASLQKLKHVQKFSDAKFDFMKTYNYSLGVSDLVPYGAAQSHDAGRDHYMRYADLVNDTMLPFVRASSGERVVDSAGNWSEGFAQASNHKYTPKLSVILHETGNNTLDNKVCPAAGNSTNETHAWADTFALTMATDLNYAAGGTNLTGSDMINFMQFCAFDTVAHEKDSPWCDVFADNQWADFEYLSDLHTYYETGYGQKLGRVQGVGYVNELLARLTGQHVQDKTQTNHTLDDSSETFPLNRTFYADFTHDNEMIAIYSALGLFNQSKDLDPKQPDDKRTWITSQMVPFSARMISEKLICKGKTSQDSTKNSTVGGDEYVRVLVNDVVQKLGFCGGDQDGLCSLSKFVESQGYARENGKGDWELCSKGPGKGNKTSVDIGNASPGRF